jgi:hypothetical protein
LSSGTLPIRFLKYDRPDYKLFRELFKERSEEYLQHFDLLFEQKSSLGEFGEIDELLFKESIYAMAIVKTNQSAEPAVISFWKIHDLKTFMEAGFISGNNSHCSSIEEVMENSNDEIRDFLFYNLDLLT